MIAFTFFVQLSSYVTEYGIDNDLANYMSTVFDPAFAATLVAMTKFQPDFKNLIGNLETALDNLLVNNNITMLQLFKNVAIR